MGLLSTNEPKSVIVAVELEGAIDFRLERFC